MNITLVVPQGSFSPESGVIFLLANYLNQINPTVSLLCSNGIFSVLEGEPDRTWRQSVIPCMASIAEQKRLADWAGVRREDLSQFLYPTEVRETKRWLMSQSSEKLINAELKGISLFDLSCESFLNRFGTSKPDINNRNHEALLRRLLLSSQRMLIASRRYMNHRTPDLSLVAGGKDFISRAYIEQAKKHNRRVALFRWEANARSIVIHHPDTDASYSCDLVLEDVSTMRPDSNTWPDQVLGIIGDILSFLDMSEHQLSLPMAAQ